jgi:type I restriction enzyme R subunit
MPTPEEKARQKIDRMLTEAGWTIQSIRELNPGAALGVAVREYPIDNGKADYALFVDRKPVGVIEAKKEGVPLTKVEEQSARYATGELKYTINKGPVPFVYESTGVETHFTDNRDPAPRAREVFSFHQPSTFQEWLQQPNTLRKRLQQFPALDLTGLRKCQERAIKNLELSFAAGRPKALVQMATGSGKTYTAITSVYRLLKFAKAKRILFLVDTKNLGEQAEPPMTINENSPNSTACSASPQISLIAPARFASARFSGCIQSLKAKILTKARSKSRFSKLPGTTGTSRMCVITRTIRWNFSI